YMDEAERCTDVGYLYMSRLLVLGKPAELKALPAVTPVGTRRYELRIPHPSERLRALRDAPGVRDATLFGEAIHAMVDEAIDAEALTQQLGVDPGVAEIRPASPTLEDVFVTLTRSAEAKAAPTSADVARAESQSTSPACDSPPAASTRETSPARGVSATQTRDEESLEGGLWAIMSKEFVHIRRQPSTLFFMLVVPVMQTIIFGYAIDTQIERIPLAVLNFDGRSSSRELVEAFENTRRFAVVERADDFEALHRSLASGRVKAGLAIPPYYSDRLVRGEQVDAQVLIDGSDSQVATTALNTAQLLGVQLSIKMARAKSAGASQAPARDPFGVAQLPLEVRPRLLYNPDLESAHFFVPGLVGIILQLVTLFLTSFAVVRERELGTLEQLFVTPVSKRGLLLGKLIPYAIAGFAEALLVLTVMIYLFEVPIRGSVLLLLSLAALFMVCSLALGLLVSTVAKTQLEAVQFAFVVMLPSVLLSGFVFPRSQMPLPIYLISFAIPVTYFIEILRGIVLRGAELADLAGPIAGLVICLTLILSLSVSRFRKQLD
ncbi:MAG: ABC transporter permease, partial [Planctomycetales bacterium]|nr:ABC transporter permease [Planctomycetales bacterium]